MTEELKYKRHYVCFFCERPVMRLPTSEQVTDLLTEVNRIYFCTNRICKAFGLLAVGVRFVDKKIENIHNKNILKKKGGDNIMDDTTQTLAAEVPAEETPVETPAETPVEETPAETPAQEQPEAGEQPAETPSVETPGEQETPAEPTAPEGGETPGQEPTVEKTEVPVEEVSQAQNAQPQS